MTREHGTRSCHVGGCRCAPCVEANRAYLADYYQTAKPYLGGVPNVNLNRARNHILTLRASGMGYDTIAADAGVQKNTIRWIALGRRTRGIRPDTERRILAVQARPQWVDSTGSMRRLRALAALGHPFDKVAAELGIHHRSVSRIACGNVPTVRASTADRVALLYAKWSMLPGPSSRVRTAAARKGWAVPLLWDEEAIDDPNATSVDPGTTPRNLVDLDEWIRLIRWGENPSQAAKRCGVVIGAVEKYAYRHGRGAEYIAALHLWRDVA